MNQSCANEIVWSQLTPRNVQNKDLVCWTDPHERLGEETVVVGIAVIWIDVVAIRFVQAKTQF